MAYDIAKALGYAEPKQAVQTHCKSGRLLFCAHANGVGGMHATFIPEGDVYKLIMRSQLPDAEKFQDWVCDEVLPSIRKHGGYLTPVKTEELLMNPDLIIQMATSLKDERAKRAEAEKQIEAQRPAVVFHASVTASNTVISVADMAKLICQNGFETGEHRLYQWLVDNKYLICRKRWSKSKNRYDNDYMPYQRFIETGLFFVTETVIQCGNEPFVKHTVKITGKGQAYFINKFVPEPELV
jgi:anti-repressor protein